MVMVCLLPHHGYSWCIRGKLEVVEAFNASKSIPLVEGSEVIGPIIHHRPILPPD